MPKLSYKLVNNLKAHLKHKYHNKIKDLFTFQKSKNLAFKFRSSKNSLNIF